MTITKDQFDAATATIAADKPALAGMQAELIKDQDTLSGLQTEVSTDQAEVNRLVAEILAAQVVVDQFNAQAPVTPPPPTSETGGYTIPKGRSPVSGFTMPTMPDLPRGTLTKRSPMDVTASKLSLVMHGNHWSGNFICIDHSNKALVMEYLELIDTLIDNDAGSAIYCGSGCGGKKAFIDRLQCKSVRPGRMPLRFCGVWPEINVGSMWVTWDLNPNTHTGDIAAAIALGNKAAGEHIGKVTIDRMFAAANRDSWPATSYWNGDPGGSAERTVESLTVNNLIAVGGPDAAFDSKADVNEFGLVYSDGNRHALKLWNKARARQVESHNPHTQGGIGGAAHFRLMGFADTSLQPPVYQVDQAWCDGTAPLIRGENGLIEAHVTGHYEGPAKAVVLTSGGKLKPESTFNGSAFPKSMLG